MFQRGLICSGDGKQVFDLTNKVILVSGGTGDIGQAIVKGLREQGATVYFTGRRMVNDEFFVQGDITVESDRLNIVNFVDGNIDVLVNCIGVTSSEFTTDMWDNIIDTNLCSVYRFISLVLNKMSFGGSIINITSIGGKLAFPNNPAYQASKGGLDMLTKAIAYDNGKNNIRANNVVPGYISTRMTRISFENPNTCKAINNRTILGRWGTPEDLVGAVVFLASDESSYITGTDIVVDGGWCAKGL